MISGRYIAILVGLVILMSSVFTVQEGQRAVVSRFSKLVKDDGLTRVYEPGLQFKIPFIDKPRFMDSRIQTLDGKPDRFVTSEKKDLMVDSFVKWRILDFEKFYLSTGSGNKITAESLLQSKINNGLRSEFGARTISEIVSGSRDELQQQALKTASDSAKDLGIEVLDVRVKQINLPREVSESIFARMRAERQAVAKEHRSQGKEQAEIIKAEIDATITVMLAEAEKQALATKGEGDAQASAIYARSYRKDASFFSFLKSLDAYQESFRHKEDVMVLSPNSEFFKYMHSKSGKR